MKPSTVYQADLVLIRDLYQAGLIDMEEVLREEAEARKRYLASKNEDVEIKISILDLYGD